MFIKVRVLDAGLKCSLEGFIDTNAPWFPQLTEFLPFENWNVLAINYWDGHIHKDVGHIYGKIVSDRPISDFEEDVIRQLAYTQRNWRHDMQSRMASSFTLEIHKLQAMDPQQNPRFSKMQGNNMQLNPYFVASEPHAHI